MSSHDHHHHDSDTQGIIRDPVCGMTVDPDAGKPTAGHDGHLYHFCSDGCRAKFVADPGAWLTAKDPVCGMQVDRASGGLCLAALPALPLPILTVESETSLPTYA